MKKEALKPLPTAKLLEKQKGLKTFIGIFVGLIICLGFFYTRTYYLDLHNWWNGEPLS